MVLYGRNPVREALRGRRRVRRIWATTRTQRSEAWLSAGAGPGETASGDEIAARCGSDAHQGLCADAENYPYAGAAELLAVPDFLLVALDEVTDPQNLGAVCRTAEVVGATGVVIPERRSAEVTPAVCKASAGAVGDLRNARLRNPSDFPAEGKAAGGGAFGAAPE